MAYRSSVIKSIQTGTISMSGIAVTATITAVVVANSFVIYEGQSGVDIAPYRGAKAVQLTNATTVTGLKNTQFNTDPLRFTVVEFYPGVLKSVQQITVALAAANTNTGTITSVVTGKTIIVPGGWTSTATTADMSTDGVPQLTLTNATTVTVDRGTNGGFTLTAYLTVVEFK